MRVRQRVENDERVDHEDRLRHCTSGQGAALQVGAKWLIAASAKLEKAAIEGKSDRACAALGTWYATTTKWHRS